jgi:hypothetical protein
VGKASLLSGLDNRSDSWNRLNFTGWLMIPLPGIEVGEVEMKCRKNRRLEEDIIFGTLGMLRCTVRLNVRSHMESFR